MARVLSLALCLLLAVLILAPSNTHPTTALVLAAADDKPAADPQVDASAKDTSSDESPTEKDDDDEDDDEPAAPNEDPPATPPEPEKPAVIDPEGEENAKGYVAPSAPGAAFFDHFQDGLGKWTQSAGPDYNGQFLIGQGKKPTIKADRALIIPTKARKYGLSAKVDGLSDLSNKPLVLQYEVKLEEGMTCGGAYLKLPLTGFEPSSFNGDTPYSVMFGPDKCGSTDKVHFIFQSENPKTGKRTEHHLKEPPAVANSYDRKTHLYTVIVNPDGKFEVRVDGEKKKDGTLSDSFDPPVQPPKQIDDPKDSKPKDWVDEKKIVDPDARKPDDWDEDAPAQIVDEEATKPEDWLEDEPAEIPDPEAKKPDGWDDEEDGKWEPKLIANPKCKAAGCGEWKRPMKSNPDYKGKWEAPMIDNPKYVGEWKPRKIDNPDYYEVTAPKLLGVGGIGFEIWTMDQGVLFDNIWLGSDAEAAEKFKNATFVKKQDIELEEEKKVEKAASKTPAAEPKQSLGPIMDRIEAVMDKVETMLEPVEAFLVSKGLEPYLDKMIDAGIKKPMIIVVSAPLMMVSILLLLLSGSRKEETSEREAVGEKKKTDAVTEDVASEATGTGDADATGESETPSENIDNGEAERPSDTVRRRLATAD